MQTGNRSLARVSDETWKETDMTTDTLLTSQQIRAERDAQPRLRARDLADKLGISEARLVAADLGQGGVTRITCDFDLVFPALERLGEVMALTRNASCVIEKVGRFANYRGGPHAALVVNEEIDLRMFPKYWVHGFAVEKETNAGPRHSLQFFDKAGDAVFKVHLREGSLHEEWLGVVDALRLETQSDQIAFGKRVPTQGPMGDPDKADKLRTEWDRMTDTHQFLQMVRKLKMNRLGAYRMAGEPYARKLSTDAVETIFNRAAEDDIPVMFFVGNMGCIEIHTGPIKTIKWAGPWLNVLDPGFDLHLRADHVAEVWAVTKSTREGPAVSVELFDAEGMIITQIFGVLRQGDKGAAWNDLVASLPGEKVVA